MWLALGRGTPDVAGGGPESSRRDRRGQGGGTRPLKVAGGVWRGEGPWTLLKRAWTGSPDPGQ